MSMKNLFSQNVLLLERQMIYSLSNEVSSTKLLCQNAFLPSYCNTLSILRFLMMKKLNKIGRMCYVEMCLPILWNVCRP